MEIEESRLIQVIEDPDVTDDAFDETARRLEVIKQLKQ